jgi:hypothetical protein
VPGIVMALVLTSYLLWSRVVVTSSEPVIVGRAPSSNA